MTDTSTPTHTFDLDGWTVSLYLGFAFVEVSDCDCGAPLGQWDDAFHPYALLDGGGIGSPYECLACAADTLACEADTPELREVLALLRSTPATIS